MRLGALFSRRVTWRVARVAPAFLESTPAPPRPEELTQLGHCGRGEGSGTWSMAPAPACLVLRGASATRVLSPAPASSPASGSAGQADALTGSASSLAPPSAPHPGQRGFAGPYQCRDQSRTLFSGVGSGIRDHGPLARSCSARLPAVARLHRRCSRPDQRVRSQSSCPKSHGSPGTIGRPHRAHKTPPTSTRTRHRSRIR